VNNIVPIARPIRPPKPAHIVGNPIKPVSQDVPIMPSKSETLEGYISKLIKSPSQEELNPQLTPNSTENYPELPLVQDNGKRLSHSQSSPMLIQHYKRQEKVRPAYPPPKPPTKPKPAPPSQKPPLPAKPPPKRAPSVQNYNLQSEKAPVLSAPNNRIFTSGDEELPPPLPEEESPRENDSNFSEAATIAKASAPIHEVAIRLESPSKESTHEIPAKSLPPSSSKSKHSENTPSPVSSTRVNVTSNIHLSSPNPSTTRSKPPIPQ
jgi:hypothetical protein